eukprot:4482671-Prymnesium_polylepis.3
MHITHRLHAPAVHSNRAPGMAGPMRAPAAAVSAARQPGRHHPPPAAYAPHLRRPAHASAHLRSAAAAPRPAGRARRFARTALSRILWVVRTAPARREWPNRHCHNRMLPRRSRALPGRPVR